MYAEEADLCLRLKKAGYKTYFYPGAEVIHLGGASAKDKPAIILSQKTVASLLLKKKHWASPAYLTYRFGSLIATSLKYLFVKLILHDKNNAHLIKCKLRSIWGMDYGIGR